LIQNVAWSAIAIHKVFGNDLKPINRWRVLQYIVKMLRSQTYTQAKVWMGVTVHQNQSFRCG